MNEEILFKVMSIGAAVLTGIAGLAAVVALIMMADDFTVAALLASLLLSVVSVGSGWATVHFAQRSSGHKSVFTNDAEREVLTAKQRRELKGMRGDVVFQRAMHEITEEQDRLIARQLNPGSSEKDDEDVHQPEPLDEQPSWNRPHRPGRNRGEDDEPYGYGGRVM